MRRVDGRAPYSPEPDAAVASVRIWRGSRGPGPQDPTINDHLGDVYWRVGRRAEARYQWERALRLEPEPQQVPQLQKKLEEGLPPPK